LLNLRLSKLCYRGQTKFEKVIIKEFVLQGL
jgi:hypothetical protein